MSAYEQLREGKPDEALAALQREIQANPADPKLRTFLFQLLAVQGKWDRALTQLDVVAEMDPGSLAMVQAYREALRCEAQRAAVFAGTQLPSVHGSADPWVSQLLEALKRVAAGDFAEAEQLRDQAFADAPESAGTLKRRAAPGATEEPAEPFGWLADADPRLGPVIEAYFEGRYHWVPMPAVKRLAINPPEDLRDVVWMPARFLWQDGKDTAALLPARYPSSELCPDPAIRLGRKTEWEEVAPGAFFGRGQKMLATDGGEYALMDIADISFDS